MNDVAAMLEIFNHGRRPERPHDAKQHGLTDDLWQLMENCWKTKPSERLSIREVVGKLVAIVTLLKLY